MDTRFSCDLFIFKKCLVSDNEVVLENKNKPQTSNFQRHAAAWQLMNEKLRRCLCTFIIYCSTLRNKTSADDRLMLSQLCTPRSSTFYRGFASLTTNFSLGRQKDPKDPNHLQQLRNKRQPLCLYEVCIAGVGKQYTLNI